MKLDELFPKRFLSGHEVKGKTFTLTIEAVTMEVMGKEQESHPVVWFVGAKKGLVLKKTNAQAIGRMYGDDTDLWPGAKVRMTTRDIKIGGEWTPSIILTPLPGDGAE